VTGSCEYGDEPSGSGATELVTNNSFDVLIQTKCPSLCICLCICIQTQIYEEKSKREVILVPALLAALSMVTGMKNMNFFVFTSLIFTLF
jgi:hypothetical protein